MRLGHLAMPILLGVITMTDGSNASPLDEFHWKNRVLVVVAPAGNAAAETQRRIYESSAKGMSERSIVLTEAADDRSGPGSPRTAGALRSFWSARTVTRPFLPTKPLSADDLFARVDAMPMRQARAIDAHALRQPPRPMTFRIGIISDTHGLLRPEAERRLAGVDHIIHGGDIGRHDIIAALRRIAPVTAIKGNVDTDDWANEYSDTELVRLAGRSIFVLHDLQALRVDPIALSIDVVVSGHSHVPKVEMVGGVLYLNPGSAGRRRFRLPITLATLDITPDGLRPTIHDLGQG